jgi:hypothetical protein
MATSTLSSSNISSPPINQGGRLVAVYICTLPDRRHMGHNLASRAVKGHVGEARAGSGGTPAEAVGRGCKRADKRRCGGANERLV